MRQWTLAIGPVRVCEGGMGQAAWAGSVPSGSGSGMRQRVTYFEAEGAELAYVVGDLAAGVALALVVVRAEVLISHTGV